MKRFVIVQDSREQRPFTFERIKPPPQVVSASLDTGDYSLERYEDKVTIERKTVLDFFNTSGQGRDRFEAELERMKNFEYAAVVVEGDWLQVLRNPPHWSDMNPRSIYASVIAWEQRYGVSFWMCPNRAFAERTTYRILERFFRDRNPENA